MEQVILMFTQGLSLDFGEVSAFYAEHPAKIVAASSTTVLVEVEGEAAQYIEEVNGMQYGFVKAYPNLTYSINPPRFFPQ